MPSRAIIPILVGMMLLTGVCNTLLTKYQDMQCVRNCDSKHPAARQTFEQPVWQTAQMFVGEMGCWLVVLGTRIHDRMRKNRTSSFSADSGPESYGTIIRRDSLDDEADDEGDGDNTDPLRKPLLPGNANNPVDPPRRPLSGWRVLLLALPAICDILGTTLMNVGLLFVAASIYQMVRGALVLFVGLFSFAFLGRRLSVAKWSALVIVVLGVAVVGMAGIFEGGDHGTHELPGKHDPIASPSPEPGHGDLIHSTMLVARNALFTQQLDRDPSAAVFRSAVGILLIFGAQLFTASQFVLEESIMERYSMSALHVVGWEGIFGFGTTVVAMIVLHFAIGRTAAGHGGYFDAVTGWHDIVNNRAVAGTSLLIMVCIGGFNFFGLSVTRNVSATSRSTIDTCRTLFIWVISLGLGWERFKWLQIAGFALLVYGAFLFNSIIGPPGLGWLRRLRGESDRRQSELLPERPIEHN